MFAVFRPAKAITLVMFIGMLFLPELATIPGMSFMDKHALTASCAILGCLLFARRRIRQIRIGRGIDLMIWAKILAMVITVTTNREPLFYGPLMLPGMSNSDAISNVLRNVTRFAFPFWLGRMAIGNSRDARILIRMVVVFGLIYSLFEIFEMRMSPSLNNWVYGIVTIENFNIAIRWGGYRPTVFLFHGLATAIFTLVSTLFAAAWSTINKRFYGMPSWAITLYLAIILILCRSTGAIILGLITLPVLWFFKPSRWTKVALIGAVLFWVYPTLRILHLFPDETLAELALTSTNEDRTQSLTFRFDNEHILVKKANERLFFGWGGYGRNRVYNEYGQDTTITDGAWIILLSCEGIISLILYFGIMTIPIFLAARRTRHIPHQAPQALLGGLAIVIPIYMLDMLLNGAFTDAPIFFAGALFQLSKVLVEEAQSADLINQWEEVDPYAPVQAAS
jgi:hypothetical protein